jgi:hypothetical protein
MIYINDLIRGLAARLGRSAAGSPQRRCSWPRRAGCAEPCLRPASRIREGSPHPAGLLRNYSLLWALPQGYLDRPNAPRKFAAPSGFLLRGTNRIDMRTALVKLRGENRHFGGDHAYQDTHVPFVDLHSGHHKFNGGASGCSLAEYNGSFSIGFSSNCQSGG